MCHSCIPFDRRQKHLIYSVFIATWYSSWKWAWSCLGLGEGVSKLCHKCCQLRGKIIPWREIFHCYWIDLVRFPCACIYGYVWMKKIHAPFSGFSGCPGTVCVCLPFTHVLIPARSSHSLCQLKLQLPTQWDPKSGRHRVNSTIWVEVHAQHKIWEKEMLVWNIYHCTPEFQKPIPSVYTCHSVTGIIDRIDSALMVLEWHCSNLHLFHYQLQK